jgi:hypothetical protein
MIAAALKEQFEAKHRITLLETLQRHFKTYRQLLLGVLLGTLLSCILSFFFSGQLPNLSGLLNRFGIPSPRVLTETPETIAAQAQTLPTAEQKFPLIAKAAQEAANAAATDLAKTEWAMWTASMRQHPAWTEITLKLDNYLQNANYSEESFGKVQQAFTLR